MVRDGGRPSAHNKRGSRHAPFTHSGHRGPGARRAACGTESSEPSSATTSTTPTTTATAIGTTTTPSEPAVDWDEIAAARYLVHGADGVWTDTGQLVWETEAVFGPDTLARDRRGGFVWLDASGLWWLPSGAAAPTLAVDGVDGDLVDVIDALVRAGGPDGVRRAPVLQSDDRRAGRPTRR